VVKQTDGEADRSPSPIADVKNCEAVLPLPNMFTWALLNYISTEKIANSLPFSHRKTVDFTCNISVIYKAYLFFLLPIHFP
jgi:hypothetical protein